MSDRDEEFREFMRDRAAVLAAGGLFAAVHGTSAGAGRCCHDASPAALVAVISPGIRVRHCLFPAA
jgi:hypothetical protein